jgi:hypothetical protein
MLPTKNWKSKERSSKINKLRLRKDKRKLILKMKRFKIPLISFVSSYKKTNLRNKELRNRSRFIKMISKWRPNKSKI